MKRCQACNKVYNDDSLNFCLDDGQWLVEVPASGEEATKILSGSRSLDDDPNLTQILPRSTSNPKFSQSSLINNRMVKVFLLFIAVVTVLGLAGIYLHRYSSNSGSDRIQSIAVMPFTNESGNPDLDYLSDGISETLISSLSQIPKLTVKSRSSVFKYKGQETDAQKIGTELKVQAILNGHVLRSGDNLRLGLELVDTSNDNVIWSGQYDRKNADIVSLQQEIARDVSDKLRLRLSSAEQAKLTKNYTSDPEAYQLYLQGRFYQNKRTEAGTKRALELFQQAVDKDPNFALAYVGISDSYLLLGIPDAMSGVLSPKESLPKARAAADKALEIDSSLAEGFASRAHARWKERDWAGADEDFRHSIELNSNYFYSHLFYAHYLAMLGRSEDAIAEIKRAQEIDPLSIPAAANLAFMYYSARRYDEAVDAAKKAIDLDPNAPLAHQRLGLSYELKGDFKDAIPELGLASEESNRAQVAVSSLAHAYGLSGNVSEANKLLDELRTRSENQYISSYNIAIVYLGLGNKDRALEYLERAYDEQSVDLLLAKVDPRLDPLRGEPRFDRILKAVFPN